MFLRGMVLSFVMGTTQSHVGAINCAVNPLCMKFLMDHGCALTACETTYLHHHHVVRMQIMFLL